MERTMNTELSTAQKTARFLITAVLMLPIFAVVVGLGVGLDLPVSVLTPLALGLVAAVHYGTGWLILRSSGAKPE
jgi:hypothetical protein